VAPVLVPAVDEDADVGPPLDVADPGERAQVGRLRLLVDRHIEDVADQDEADWHQPRAAVGCDGAKGRGAGARDEAALGLVQRHARGLGSTSV